MMKKLWLLIVMLLTTLCLFACTPDNQDPQDPPTPPTTYVVTILNDNAARGSATGAGTYEEGAQVELVATAAQGYALLGWYEDGVLVSQSKTYSFTLTGDREIVVKWQEAWSGIV